MLRFYEELTKVIMSVSYKWLNVQKSFSRSFFHWINIQFNVLDETRRAEFGPDRTCAEWILRNGGAVRFSQIKQVFADYNTLPDENEKMELTLEEIDATDSSIMTNGFVHFIGCKHIRKVIFHKCNYLEDDAFKYIGFLKNSLMDLQISSCGNISEKGLVHLKVLKNLKRLSMFDLIQVKNMKKLTDDLRSALPNCEISAR